jgi:DNA-binding response OmpR family regulator
MPHAPIALVVESDPAELWRMTLSLRALGWKAIGAPDAPEACALLCTFHPALIIAQDDAPGVAELAQQAREAGSFARLIAVSDGEIPAEEIPLWDAEARRPLDVGELLWALKGSIL